MTAAGGKVRRNPQAPPGTYPKSDRAKYGNRNVTITGSERPGERTRAQGRDPSPGFSP